MTDFILGLTIGALIVGIITTPFLTYFGIIFFNFRKMEKKLTDEMDKPNTPIEIKKTDAEAVREAEKLLEEYNKKK